MEAERLRLALAVISGRKTEFFDEEYATLGYEPHRFDPYGRRPPLDDVKEMAESILFEAATRDYGWLYAERDHWREQAQALDRQREARKRTDEMPLESMLREAGYLLYEMTSETGGLTYRDERGLWVCTYCHATSTTLEEMPDRHERHCLIPRANRLARFIDKGLPEKEEG